MAEAPLFFPSAEAQRLEPHLPPQSQPSSGAAQHSLPPLLPFVTLTFATSLDSMLALGPGIRTALSGPQSKAMTHYLRSRHDAICIGVGTAIADDPGLNCRLAAAGPGPKRGSIGEHVDVDGGTDEGVGGGGGGGGNERASDGVTDRQPRPIIVDPHLRWDFTADSKVMRLARAGKGLAPYIVTLEREPAAPKKKLLGELGGKFIFLLPHQAQSTDVAHSAEGSHPQRFDWRAILSAVRAEGLRSIMIEGGGEVINSLLGEDTGLVDSVIVTIAPTWLGQGGVVVSPSRKASADRPVARLTDTAWMPLGEDVVLCGRIAR
ncbi:bacterial bifunctional deaminase-reductase [Xylariaceae sp. FL1651]|nr:bacterial bifunctional deaminase-reductase [Xylariaceae sp. FL1651]